MANCILRDLAVKVVQTVSINCKDLFRKELIAVLGGAAKFTVSLSGHEAMCKDGLRKGKGAVLVDSRALFLELEPSSLCGPRNIGHTI